MLPWVFKQTVGSWRMGQFLFSQIPERQLVAGNVTSARAARGRGAWGPLCSCPGRPAPGTGWPAGPCAPWLLLLMACVVWPLFLPFFKIQQTLIIFNSSQNKIEGESQLFILKYSVSETYRANIWGLWELNLSLKLTYTRVKGLLFFICFSKITLMAVLSATLACGGRELPFLMKAWAWASCQNSRGRSMAQRGISRAQNLTDEQANVSGNPFSLNDHMY